MSQNVSADPVEPVVSRSSWRSRICSALSTQHSALILLILIGAILRFTFLDKPPIWYDEAATFARTCGTYQQMLDSLEEAGFSPLHYSVYWWIKHGMPLWGRFEIVKVNAFTLGNGFGRIRPGAHNGKVEARDLIPTHPIISSGEVLMTPFMLRLIPAICGVLMIPAMYWLAIELSRRKDIALLAAALTTFSAYLLNYSRDAKMYMELWLFVALNIASLLWWIRKRTWTSWMCWIVTGTITLGLHGLGAIAIAVELLFVLTSQRLLPPRIHFNWPGFINLLRATWAMLRRSVLVAFFVGVALMSIGPVGYFWKFNQYVKRINEVGWMGTGVQWIPEYNRFRTGPELLKYATSAFFTSWEWPKPRDEYEIAPRVTFWLKNGCFAMGILAIVGLFPWRRFLRKFRRRTEPIPLDDDKPRWRTIFCVVIWIVLPVYVVYLLSIGPKEFPNASPTHWLDAFASLWRDHLWLKIALPAAALLAFYFSGRSWRERFVQSAFFILTLVVAWGFMRGTYWLFDSKSADLWMGKLLGKGWKTHGSLWIPRYLGVAIPAVFIAAATLISRLPRYVRAVAILLFVAINCCQYGAQVFAGSEPPVDYMVKDSIAWRENEKHDNTMKMYYSVQRPTLVAGLGPGTGVLGLPTSKYYWNIDTQSVSDPDDIRGFDMMNSPHFPHQLFGSMANSIKSDVKKSPKLKTLIVWDSLRPGKTETTDAVQDALGSDWSREGDRTFYVREHWTWRNLETIRRRVYVKNASAASTMPTSIPATSPAK